VVEVIFVAIVMMFEDFGATFVYVVVRRFVFNCGLALFLVFPFIDFRDSPLLGDVSYRFLDFVFDARVYGLSIGGSTFILCMLLF